jgi:hypothetical protein
MTTNAYTTPYLCVLIARARKFYSQRNGWTWLDKFCLWVTYSVPLIMVVIAFTLHKPAQAFNVGGLLLCLAGAGWIATGVLLSRKERIELAKNPSAKAAEFMAVASGRVFLSVLMLSAGTLFQIASTLWA